jgi:hypothetical protein
MIKKGEETPRLFTSRWQEISPAVTSCCLFEWQQLIKAKLSKSTLFCKHFPAKVWHRGCALDVHFLLLGQQFLHGFTVHFVGYATVNRTYRRTLGFFMETLAFGTFIGSNIVGVNADGLKTLFGIHYGAVHQGKIAFYSGSVNNSPFHATLINGIVGAFGLTGAAIDTFFCYFNGHTKTGFVGLVILHLQFQKYG